VRAAVTRREEACTGLQFVHDAERHVTEARVLRRRHHRDRHAARLEPGGGRTGAVDGIDHEEGAGLAVDHEAAVLGVEADVARHGQLLFDDAFGDLVDRERGVAAGCPPDSCTRRGSPEQRPRRRHHVLRHPERQRLQVIHRAHPR
jgi:hypothetical protein